MHGGGGFNSLKGKDKRDIGADFLLLLPDFGSGIASCGEGEKKKKGRPGELITGPD